MQATITHLVTPSFNSDESREYFHGSVWKMLLIAYYVSTWVFDVNRHVIPISLTCTSLASMVNQIAERGYIPTWVTSFCPSGHGWYTL